MTLTAILAPLAKVESAAIGAIVLLAESYMLSDEDVRFLTERMTPDELAHSRMLSAWARSFGDTPAPMPLATMYMRDLGVLPQLPPLSQAPAALAITRMGELESLAAWPHWLRNPEFPGAFVTDIQALLADEKEHLRCTHRILRHWEREHPLLARYHARVFEAMKPAYRALMPRLS